MSFGHGSCFALDVSTPQRHRRRGFDRRSVNSASLIPDSSELTHFSHVLTRSLPVLLAHKHSYRTGRARRGGRASPRALLAQAEEHSPQNMGAMDLGLQGPQMAGRDLEDRWVFGVPLQRFRPS